VPKEQEIYETLSGVSRSPRDGFLAFLQGEFTKFLSSLHIVKPTKNEPHIAPRNAFFVLDYVVGSTGRQELATTSDRMKAPSVGRDHETLLELDRARLRKGRGSVRWMTSFGRYRGGGPIVRGQVDVNAVEQPLVGATNEGKLSAHPKRLSLEPLNSPRP
jgi:hypothetical protein